MDFNADSDFPKISPDRLFKTELQHQMTQYELEAIRAEMLEQFTEAAPGEMFATVHILDHRTGASVTAPLKQFRDLCGYKFRLFFQVSDGEKVHKFRRIEAHLYAPNEVFEWAQDSQDGFTLI